MYLAAFAFIAVSLIVRLLFVLRTPTRQRVKQRRVMVVLGSGGHTSEMFGCIEQLPKEDWATKTVLYVVSATDKDSKGVAERFELDHLGRRARVSVIPRAREVGQSYFSSIFSTLRAFASAVVLVMDHQPDAILTNGPGVCIPVVAANLLLSTLFPGRQRATMTYFESFTCVDHLSLSGKIMLRLADVFTVQWPELKALLPKRRHIHYAGRFTEVQGGDGRPPPLLLSGGSGGPMLGEGKERRTCVITVGSTKFDELISVVDSPEFNDAVTDLGINDVFIQKGRSSIDVTGAFPSTLMQRRVVEYQPGLNAMIRSASLVIAHAGAGTILEAMGAAVPTIVVPNERLMSNHQVQLARALSDRHHLLYATPQTLVSTLRGHEWATLRRFPPPNAVALKRAVLPILE